MKRIVSVWKPTMRDAHLFIHGHGIEEFFIQFLPDPDKGLWVVLGIQNNVWQAVKSVPTKTALTVIE